MSKTVDIQKLKVEIRNALNQQNANIVAQGEAKGTAAHLAIGLVNAWGKDQFFTAIMLGYIQGYVEAKGLITESEFEFFYISTEVVKEFVLEWNNSRKAVAGEGVGLPEELVELLQVLKALGDRSPTRH